MDVSQQIALASYIHPNSGKELWARMTAYPSDKLTVLVANVMNGPDSFPHEEWAHVIEQATSTGKTVIGYVRTGYLGVSQQKFQTMLGSNDLADWIAQIERDVELWYSLYGARIGGIFFDEGMNECGPNNLYADVYRLLSENIKRKHPGAYTVLNPGIHVPQCFADSADTLMTFESNFTMYLKYDERTDGNGWTAKDPRKIWHIIYNVAAADVDRVTALAKERGAGLLHITDGDLPNPYNVLPDEGYMRTLMSSVGGGTPFIDTPPPLLRSGNPAPPPPILRVTESDYTSVSLEWSSTSIPAGGFGIYSDESSGQEIVRLPGSMNRVTIGGFEPGNNQYLFAIRAYDEDGSSSAWSPSVSAITKTLPEGKTLHNPKVTISGGKITYQVDTLVPYAFTRMYSIDPDTESCSFPAWPTNFRPGEYVCAHYMIEGQALYTYSATSKNNEGNWPWIWLPTTPLDKFGHNIDFVQDGYTHVWTIPAISSTKIPNPDYFVVQAEGYGPKTNVFLPCPDTMHVDDITTTNYCIGENPYSCKGSAMCSTLLQAKFCDMAANDNLQRDSTLYVDSPDVTKAGACHLNGWGGGCKIVIEGKMGDGKPCTITGAEMWDQYQDLKKLGNCNKCGSKRLSDGCLLRVNYYTGFCPWSDGGPIKLLDDVTEVGGEILGELLG